MSLEMYTVSAGGGFVKMEFDGFFRLCDEWIEFKQLPRLLFMAKSGSIFGMTRINP